MAAVPQLSPEQRLDLEIELRKRIRKRLEAAIAIAYPEGGEAEYRETITKHGNAPDQIASFERAGICLQPKQLEFCAWARRADSTDEMPHITDEGENVGTPEIGMGGAKGGGKSMSLFTQAALDDCQRFPGLKVLYLRKAGNKAREQMQDMVSSILKWVDYEYTQGLIRFPNGSRIVVGHFQNPKEALNYAGIEYDVVIIEEATQLPKRSYLALRTAARSSKEYNGVRWRPRVYNSTNPLGVGHTWYKETFVKPERKSALDKNAPKRNRKFIPATVRDNQFVNPEYRGTLESLSGVERRAYLEGDWDVAAGAYFETYRHEIHVIRALDDLSAFKRLWASMDYGYNHWNICYLHGERDGIKYTLDELAHRRAGVPEIAADIKAWLSRYSLLPKNLDYFLAGQDIFAETGHSPDPIHRQYVRAGVHMTQAVMGPGSRIKGAHYIQQLLGDPQRDKQPMWFITERCPMLIECLPTLQRNPNNLEDVLKVDADEDGEGGDDAYDAARYGLFLAGKSTIA